MNLNQNEQGDAEVLWQNTNQFTAARTRLIWISDLWSASDRHSPHSVAWWPWPLTYWPKWGCHTYHYHGLPSCQVGASYTIAFSNKVPGRDRHTDEGQRVMVPPVGGPQNKTMSSTTVTTSMLASVGSVRVCNA